MSINYPDFANIKPVTTGNLFEPYMEGRNFSESLKQKALERALLSLQNQHQQTANEFQRPMLEQGMQKGEADLLHQQLVNQFLPQEKQSEIGYRNASTGLTQQQIREKQLENVLNEKYGEQTRQAEIAAKHRAGMNLSTAASDAAAAWGYGSPEFNHVIKRIVGSTPFPEGIPSNFRSLEGINHSARNSIYKKQDEAIERANKASVTIDRLDKVEEILNKHPDLYKSFSAVILDPENNDLKNRLLKRMTNAKEREAFETLTKHTNQLVIDYASSLNARPTDALRDLVEKSKIQAGLSTGASKEIIKSMKEELEPVISYGDDVVKAQVNNYDVIYVPKIYKDKIKKEKSINKNSEVGRPVGESVTSPEQQKMQLELYIAEQKKKGRTPVKNGEKIEFIPRSEVPNYLLKNREARVYGR